MTTKRKAPLQVRTSDEDDRLIEELRVYMKDFSFKEVTKPDVVRFAIKQLHEKLIRKENLH